MPLASGRPGTDGLIPLDQDATLFAATVLPGRDLVLPLAPGRGAYLVPARGTVSVNGVAVPERAGAAVTGEDSVVLHAEEAAEIVLLDLPLAQD